MRECQSLYSEVFPAFVHCSRIRNAAATAAAVATVFPFAADLNESPTPRSGFPPALSPPARPPSVAAAAALRAPDGRAAARVRHRPDRR